MPSLTKQEQAIVHAADLKFAWKHAYEYAKPYSTHEQASEYADFYVTTIGDESDIRFWPSHSVVFTDWHRINRDI